ncbi:MAG: TAXI family TRAP transporter solute-binding subunit [Enterocloster sp.]
MKKNKTALLFLAAAMAASLLAGCGGSQSGASDTKAAAETTAAAEAQTTQAAAAGGSELKFTTGGDQGTYYGFGSVLAGQVSGATDTKITAITSGGSQANIEALEVGDAQLGFVQSDVMAYAYEGTNLFDGAAVKDFSTVAALYMEQVQIVTCNPDIKSVEDLKGKNVSIGAPGSGVYFNAMDILGAYGMTEDDINPTYESFGDSAESLQDGKIDAAFITAGAPTTAVTSLGTSKQVYLVGLDDAHIDTLIASCPYYSKNVIAADTYGLDGDVTTVAVGAVVIARDDVAEADVYNFVSTVFENKDVITNAHAKGAELDDDFAASVTAVPYHAGAAKYFKEKGLDVPVK